MEKICRDCGEEFELSPKEADWYYDRGLNEPERCQECRNTRRELQDEWVTCKICQENFIWAVDDQRAFRTYKGADGYQAPKCCPNCREELQELQEEIITCWLCHNAFSFSPTQQLSYRIKGWSTPTKCQSCREKTRNGNSLEIEIYNSRGDLVGRSYRQGNKTEQYDLNGQLAGTIYHYKDHSEHFDSTGVRKGITYHRDGHSEYYDVHGQLVRLGYHHQGHTDYFDINNNFIGRTRF